MCASGQQPLGKARARRVETPKPFLVVGLPSDVAGGVVPAGHMHPRIRSGHPSLASCGRSYATLALKALGRKGRRASFEQQMHLEGSTMCAHGTEVDVLTIKYFKL